MPRPPLRALVLALVAVGLALAAIAALTGLVVILALVVALAVLNIVYLPRIARRLRLPVGWVALMLIPFMVMTGVALDGVPGVGWGIGIWLGAIGLPRVIGRELTRRTRRRLESRLGYIDVAPRAAAADEASGGTAAMRPTTNRGVRPWPPADGPGRGEYGP